RAGPGLLRSVPSRRRSGGRRHLLLRRPRTGCGRLPRRGVRRSAGPAPPRARRRPPMKALTTLAVAAGAFLVGAPWAHADEELQAILRNAEGDELGAYNRRHAPYESPQTVAFELRFGRYVPDADEGVEGTPFADVFGGSSRYYGGLELSWQALRIPYVGTFGPGFGIGYTRATAKALLESGEGRSSQPTSLTIIPMYVVGVLRADELSRRTPVPLVPYAKLGVGYAIW